MYADDVASRWLMKTNVKTKYDVHKTMIFIMEKLVWFLIGRLRYSCLCYDRESKPVCFIYGGHMMTGYTKKYKGRWTPKEKLFAPCVLWMWTEKKMSEFETLHCAYLCPVTLHESGMQKKASEEWGFVQPVW